MEKYLSWKVVATTIIAVLISVMGGLYTERGIKLRLIDEKIEKKVDSVRYATDMEKIEKKLDLLINIHMKK